MNTGPPTTVVREQAVSFRELEGGDPAALLLHLESGAYFGLNDLGVRVWALLEQPATVDDVQRRLRSELPDAPARMEEDVAAFVAVLIARGLARTTAP